MSLRGIGSTSCCPLCDSSEWCQRKNKDEGKSPSARVIQVRHITESIAGARQSACDVIQGRFDFDIAQPRLPGPLQERNRGVQFKIQLMRVTVQVVRKCAPTVLVDDVKMAADPSARVLGPQPLEIQLGFQFG